MVEVEVDMEAEVMEVAVMEVAVMAVAATEEEVEAIITEAQTMTMMIEVWKRRKIETSMKGRRLKRRRRTMRVVIGLVKEKTRTKH